MAAWQFSANGKLYIAAKSTNGKWYVLGMDRKTLPGGPYKTRKEAMLSRMKGVA